MEHTTIAFDATLHSADAIQRAAYMYCANFSLEIQRSGDEFRCTLRFLDDGSDHTVLTEDFRIEVLDQVLRERIRNETEAARNVVLALAFSKTTLLEG